MKQHLAILLWATDPDLPHLCATPFFHAAACAAMDVEVEIYFSAKSVKLLVPGVAECLMAGREGGITIYQHMQQAVRHGARFIACTDALEAHQVDRNVVIPEVSGFGGASAFIGRALDPEWSVLTF
jgi:predicted peroxiredoxin